MLWRFWPVWVALAIVMGTSFLYKKKLALYGRAQITMYAVRKGLVEVAGVDR